MTNALGRSFNSNVLVGNWFEDQRLDEETLKDFLSKRDNGQLLSQRFGGLTKELLRPVKLSLCHDSFVHFGDTVMLVNAGTSARNVHAASGWQRKRAALGFCITTSDLLAMLQSTEPTSSVLETIRALTFVAWSNRLDPCVLNSFIVRSVDGSAPGTTLKYGQPFELELVGDTGSDPRVLTADNGNTGTATKKTRHIGVNAVRRSQAAAAASGGKEASEGSRAFATHFAVEHADPQWRMEYEGMPVAANASLLVTHLKSNQHVAAEDQMLRTPFGVCYEASVQTYLDSHKAERDNNLWALTLGVPGDAAFADCPEGSARVHK